MSELEIVRGDSAEANGKAAPAKVEFELDIANRLVEQHGGDLRYATGVGWFVWDGRYWARDRAEAAQERVKHVLAQLRWQSAALKDDALWKLTKSTARSAGVNSVLSLARSDPRIRIGSRDLNPDPLLVNVANGTLDVRTGKLREHRRQDLITHLIRQKYVADAPRPRWACFIGEVTKSRADLAQFLQRWVGYCLTGSTREHALVMLTGSGCNGKTTLLDTLQHVIGEDLVATAPPGLLLWQRNDRHPTELDRLRGKRLVIANELPIGGRFNEQRLKALTGSDIISARGMHQDFTDFVPQHKFMIACNDRPRVRDTSPAFWRRVREAPFDACFAGKEDRNLCETLRGEAEGILSWAAKGALDWYKHGLPLPDCVKLATNEYKKSEDQLGQFLTAHIVFDPNERTAKCALREAFEDFLDGERMPPARRLAEALRAAGAGFGVPVTDTTVQHFGKTVRAWKGLALIQTANGANA